MRGHDKGLEGGGGGWGGSSATWDLRAPSTAWGGGWGGSSATWDLRAPLTTWGGGWGCEIWGRRGADTRVEAGGARAGAQWIRGWRGARAGGSEDAGGARAGGGEDGGGCGR
jgi:hypothetical protein